VDDLTDRLLDHPEDLLLVAAAAVLLILCANSLRGLLALRRDLEGRAGHSVTSALAAVVAAVTAGQALSLVSALLIVYDRSGTLEGRIWLFIVTEALEVGGIVYGVRQAKRIATGRAEKHHARPRRRWDDD
jgi:hypothetical protein